MFAKPEPLDRNKHADLKFSPAANYKFAAHQSSAPIPASEVVTAARHFPIVFPEKREEGGRIIPQAILSMRQGENAFVQEDGKWTVPYVPAHIRRYPFILGEIKDGDKFALMLDVEAPQFGGKGGEPLFKKAEGSDELVPGELVVQAREFLSKFQQELVRTAKLLEALEEKEVLAPRRVDIKLNDNQTSLGGFRTVDTEKLTALDDKTLADWTRTGIMSVIFAHLHSLGNMRELARLQPDMLGSDETQH